MSRRLVEHRAGVLSESVRRNEEDKRGDTSNGYGTPTNPLSPASSAFSFFAGHPSSAVPNSSSLLPQAAQQQITQLEEQLRAATASLSEASKKQAETTRELNLLRLEKDQVETILGMEVQAAQDKTISLENEVLPKLETELENFRREKDYWEEERDAYQAEKTRWENERTMLEQMQQAKGGADAMLAEVRQNMLDMQQQLDAKEGELRQLQTQLSQSQSQLSQTQLQLSQLEQSHTEVTEDLDSGRAFVQTLVQTHAIVLFSRDPSLKGLLSAIGTHLEGLSNKLLSTEQASAQRDAELRQRESEWEAQKRRLEEDVRMGLDKREELSRELDISRRERENMSREMIEMKVGSFKCNCPCIFICTSLQHLSPDYIYLRTLWPSVRQLLRLDSSFLLPHHSHLLHPPRRRSPYRHYQATTLNTLLQKLFPFSLRLSPYGRFCPLQKHERRNSPRVVSGHSVPGLGQAVLL